MLKNIFLEDIPALPIKSQSNDKVIELEAKLNELTSVKDALMQEQTTNNHRKANLESELARLKVEVLLDNAKKTRLSEIEKELKEVNKQPDNTEQIYYLNQAINKLMAEIQQIEESDITKIEIDLIKQIDAKLDDFYKDILTLEQKYIDILPYMIRSANFKSQVMKSFRRTAPSYSKQLFGTLLPFYEQNKITTSNFLRNKDN